LEATRLIARHPHAKLKFCTSDRWVGESVSRRAGLEDLPADLSYIAVDAAPALFGSCDAVFLCTPAEVSLKMAPKIAEAGARVIDLSGAFRLKDAAGYPTHYGFTHDQPALLKAAVYALPELFREKIRGAKVISNPGCYATAGALALAPLLKAKLATSDDLIVDAASGVTGAGRKATEEYSFTEIADDFRAYKVLKHQHTPEIAQTLAAAGGSAVDLTFTPHLLPLKRGILATAYATLKPGATASAVATAYADAYGPEPFVSVASSADAVSMKSVLGTNRCVVGVAVSGRRVVVTCALDNLVKGAAGQAVQNLNLAMGWEETSGLKALVGRYP
jgi:N-acetyl-gamma-glutamyl-phosphate reductase